MLNINYYNIMILVTMITVLFRNTLTTLGGSTVGYLFLLPILISSLILLYLLLNKNNLSFYYIILFLIYTFILIILFPFIGYHQHYAIPLIGFTNLCANLVFWVTMLNDKNKLESIFSSYHKHCSYILTFIALGAIVQFFISPDLFGLISNEIYTQDLSEKLNVSKRAISFIASPQTLSLVLAFGLTFVFHHPSKFSVTTKVGITTIMGFAGLLTFSKAFFLYLAIYYSIFYFQIKYIPLLLFAIAIILSPIYFWKEEFIRILDILYYIQNIQQYSAFQVWESALAINKETSSILLGAGIGVYARGAQEIAKYIIGYGSTESFWLQVYIETGLIGFILLLILLFYIVFKNFKERLYISATIISFSIIGIFTPALYGFASSFLFYSIVIYGLYQNPIEDSMKVSYVH